MLTVSIALIKGNSAVGGRASRAGAKQEQDKGRSRSPILAPIQNFIKVGCQTHFAIERFWLVCLAGLKIAVAISNSFYDVFLGQYQFPCQILSESDEKH